MIRSGSSCCFRGVDFAEIFAEFRRNPVELERVVKLFLGFTRNPLVVLQAVQAVLVQGEAHLQGALAERDTVTL